MWLIPCVCVCVAETVRTDRARQSREESTEEYFTVCIQRVDARLAEASVKRSQVRLSPDATALVCGYLPLLSSALVFYVQILVFFSLPPDCFFFNLRLSFSFHVDVR